MKTSNQQRLAHSPNIHPYDDRLVGFSLSEVTERLLNPQPEEPKSLLQPYFEGCKEFAKEYIPPSPSPDPSDLIPQHLSVRPLDSLPISNANDDLTIDEPKAPQHGRTSKLPSQLQSTGISRPLGPKKTLASASKSARQRVKGSRVKRTSSTDTHQIRYARTVRFKSVKGRVANSGLLAASTRQSVFRHEESPTLPPLKESTDPVFNSCGREDIGSNYRSHPRRSGYKGNDRSLYNALQESAASKVDAAYSNQSLSDDRFTTIVEHLLPPQRKRQTPQSARNKSRRKGHKSALRVRKPAYTSRNVHPMQTRSKGLLSSPS